MPQIQITLKNLNNLNNMPNENNECFMAVYEEYCDTGSTLKIALADLKSSAPTFDDDEVQFYRAKEFIVERQLVEVPE